MLRKNANYTATSLEDDQSIKALCTRIFLRMYTCDIRMQFARKYF